MDKKRQFLSLHASYLPIQVLKISLEDWAFFCMCKNVQSLPPGGDILCFSIHIPLWANEARLRYRGLNCYWYFFAAIFLIVTIV